MSTRFGFVSTFPPTQCGLATFTAALLHASTDEGWVVRLAAIATAPQLLWPVIADQYRELADRLITASVAA
jgi:hypothetical protein